MQAGPGVVCGGYYVQTVPVVVCKGIICRLYQVLCAGVLCADCTKCFVQGHCVGISADFARCCVEGVLCADCARCYVQGYYVQTMPVVVCKGIMWLVIDVCNTLYEYVYIEYIQGWCL